MSDEPGSVKHMYESNRIIRGHQWLPNGHNQWPALYSTEEVKAGDKIIVARYFLSNSEWFIAEIDRANKLAFGYAILAGDLMNSEWGYIDLNPNAELQNLRLVSDRLPLIVERDLSWEPKPARECVPESGWRFDEGRD